MWRMVVAFTVLLLLLTALVVVSRSDPDTSETAAAPTQDTPVPTAGRATTSSSIAPQPQSSPEEVLLEHTQDALDAWGVFAATGNLDVVRETFGAGPQLEQLRSEAEHPDAVWPGLPAFRFAIAGSSVSSLNEEAALVRVSIEMSREPGVTADAFSWDIEMRWDGAEERWRLYTVSTVEG